MYIVHVWTITVNSRFLIISAGQLFNANEACINLSGGDQFFTVPLRREMSPLSRVGCTRCGRGSRLPWWRGGDWPELRHRSECEIVSLAGAPRSRPGPR